MKKGIKFLIIISVVTLLMSVSVFANEPSVVTDENMVTTVSGFADSTRDDISILVLYPGVTSQMITPENTPETIFYHWQTHANADKSYSFRFAFDEDSPDGGYTVIINTAGDTGAYVTTVWKYSDLYIEISSDMLGNIYFDASDISFNMNIKSTPNLKTDFEIVTCVTDESGALVYEDTREYESNDNGTGDINHKISLENATKQFGFFNVQCTVRDKISNKSCELSTRFSVVNVGEDNMNYSMGIQQHLQNGYGNEQYGAKDMDKFLDLFKRTGYNLQRETLNWHVFEAKKGVYSFRKDQKQELEYMKAKGLTPFIILGLSNSLYFDTDEQGNKIWISKDPEYIKAFGNYCYEAVKQTMPYTNQYEILNEYNMDGSRFNQDFGTPSDYVDLMKAAYTNAKRANPDCIVYGVSAAYVMSGYSYNTFEWIDEVFKAGGGQYMDGLSFHVYTNTKKPEESNKKAITQNIRTIMEKYGYGDMELIITETGYSSDINTEIEQAKYELRDYALLYNEVDKLMWYNAIEKPNESDYEHALGFVRMGASTDLYKVDIPYEAKPVYLAMANWNTLLANSKLVNEKISGSVYDYSFITADGRSIHMIWNSDNTEVNYTLNSDSENVTLYDMYGNNTDVSGEGSFVLTVTGEPLYVDEGGIIDVSFEDANNQPVETIVNPLNVTVSGNSGFWNFADSAMVLIAEYKDNVFANCYTKTITQDDPAFLQTLSTEDISDVSVYVWDDDSFSPYIKKIQLQK